jgi:hypothetical protein
MKTWHDHTMAKMMAIQAEADHTQIVVEQGTVMREYNETMAEYGRLDEVYQASRAKGKDLLREFQSNFIQAGKTQEEVHEMINVPHLAIQLTNSMRPKTVLR